MKTESNKIDIAAKTKELHQAKGLLEVAGHLDLSQFWPTGTSDADTAHVTIDLAAGPFQFRQTLTGHPKATHAFDDGWVHGRTTQPAIHGKNKNNPFLVIRLQGIDAPELHYQPQEKNTKDFRQVLGETCTVELETGVKKSAAAQVIPCSVVTSVDHPGDAFDTFGRLIGDILIPQNAGTLNLNHWLVEHGWAYPTYYDSMTVAEIQAYENLLPKAKQNAAGVYGHLTPDIADLDWNLLFRPHGPVQKEPAGKNTIMPKIFRRLAAWAVKKKNGGTNDAFIAFIKGLPHDQRQCLLLEEFMQGKRNIRNLDEFVLANNVNGHFTKNPEQLVFVESPSKLFDQQQGGNEITKW